MYMAQTLNKKVGPDETERIKDDFLILNNSELNLDIFIGEEDFDELPYCNSG